MTEARICQDWVLVEMDAPPSKVGSIIISDIDMISYNRSGHVLACGPGKYDAEGKHIPMQVAVGDRVVFPVATQQFRSPKLVNEALRATLKRDNVALIKESEILLVVDDEVKVL